MTAVDGSPTSGGTPLEAAATVTGTGGGTVPLGPATVTGTGGTAPIEAVPAQAAPAQAAPAQAAPAQAVPAQAVPTQAVSTQAVSTQAVPTQAVSTQATGLEPVAGGEPARSDAKRALLERRLKRTTAVRRGIDRRPSGSAPPLSYAQERLWFMEQFAPGTSAYGVPLLLRLGPGFDADAMVTALSELTARHESLRMRFPSTEDGRPTVVVEPVGVVPLPVVDVPDERAAQARLAADAARPFDLAAGPLLRVEVLRVGGSGADGPTASAADHIVLIDLHHIVTDGWSNETLLAELAELYRAYRDGRPHTLGPAPVRYGDFAGWQRARMDGPGAQRDLTYWLGQLAGVPALELPTDAPRPATQTFDGASHRFRLDNALVTGLTELGRTHRATLFMTLLAGYCALLGRYSGQTDFAVGSPVAGRSHPDLDGVIGMFVNMLPLRAELAGDPTGAGLVERTRETVFAALDHQEVPFEKVINDLGVVRDVSRPALFQAMFVLQNYDQPGRADAVGIGTDIGWKPVDLPATRFDLELHAYTGTDGLECRFVYNTALFSPDTMARMAAHLQTLLRDLVAHPERRLSELRLLGGAEQALISAWNATDAPRRVGATLPGLVADQALRSPDAVAVLDEQSQLTYAELDRAANRVAHRLRAEGVGAGSIVAVCAERSVELVTALLGVVKAGAAYLPLDPDYPADRLAYMLDDSGARVVLTQSRLTARLPGTATGAMPAGRPGTGPTTLLLDDAVTWADQPDTAPSQRVSEEAAAYLIYTSGSTGRPKGVLNAHRGIVNRLDWMQELFGLGADDVVLQKTPASFDVSVWEFFWPLITGARLVLARPGGQKDPSYLREADRVVRRDHGALRTVDAARLPRRPVRGRRVDRYAVVREPAPDRVQRRGAAGGTGPPLRGRAARRGAAQPVRPDRGRGRRDRVAVRAGQPDRPGPGADRRAGTQYAGADPGPRHAPGTDRCGRRAAHRRRTGWPAATTGDRS